MMWLLVMVDRKGEDSRDVWWGKEQGLVIKYGG